MKWITRERPKIDRIACPWLIARFIDPKPEFLYVPPQDVMKVAADTGATPYDVKGVALGHKGDRCSFDAFMEQHGLNDVALTRLAEIVRAADTGRPEAVPEATGLLAISRSGSSPSLSIELGKNAIKDRTQIAIAVAAAAAMLLPQIGLVMILLLSGCIGIALFDARRSAAIGFAIVLAGLIVVRALEWVYTGASAGSVAPSTGSATPGLWEVGAFFVKVGALTFGGGLSMLAFMQEQVVVQFGWLSPQEFVDGLALGQLTPGPILLLAAFIGFKLHGVGGAAISAGAIFLPSFLLMLTILPLLRKMGNLGWLKPFMRGVGPAVIGALAVSLAQMAPHAAPDWITWILLAGTIALMLWKNTGPLGLMLGGGAFGIALNDGWFGRLRELVR